MPKKQIKKISVILQQSVAQLGQIGEIKKVNRGYAFNFLCRNKINKKKLEWDILHEFGMHSLRQQLRVIKRETRSSRWDCDPHAEKTMFDRIEKLEKGKRWWNKPGLGLLAGAIAYFAVRTVISLVWGC